MSDSLTPEYVLWREFSGETVMLNTETEQYHGLNRTGARVFQLLVAGETVESAASILAGEYGLPVEEVRGHCLRLCRKLEERGLIEPVTSLR